MTTRTPAAYRQGDGVTKECCGTPKDVTEPRCSITLGSKVNVSGADVLAVQSSLRICRAMAVPSGMGTALPIWRAMAEPMKRCSSGKPWRRAAS